MGFLSDAGGILGGSSSSAGSSVFKEQVPFLEDLFKRSQLASLDDSGGQFAQAFNQPSFDAFNQLAQGGQQADFSGLSQIAAGDTGLAQFQNQQNTALQGAIDAGLGQITQNFQQNLLPSINQGSALAGTSGGSRQGIAQGLALQGANQQATDFVNQLTSQNFNQMQDRNLQAGTAGLQGQLSAFGQLGQGDIRANQAQQAALQAAPSVSNLGFSSQFGNLNQLAGLIGSPTVLGGASTQQGGIGGSLSGAANLGALAFLSDERTKENSKKVGKLDNGLNVYSYNYIGNPTPQIGLIAQEVEKVIPEAVIEISGFKHVFYDKATGAV